MPTTPAPQTLGARDEFEVILARIAPLIRELLGDAIPRRRQAILAALADKAPRPDLRRSLMRLTITGEVVETGGCYRLAETKPSQG